MRTGGLSSFATVNVVNWVVAAIVLAGDLVADGLLQTNLSVGFAVVLALSVPLVLARCQSAPPDDARLTPGQWALFGALWAGTVLWSVASTWASLAEREASGWFPALGQGVAVVAWVGLVVHLSARVGGRRLRRWSDLVFAVMIPGNLAIIWWVLLGGAIASGESSWDSLFVAVAVLPILLALLSVSTVLATWTAWSVPGGLLPPRQAGLQIGQWVGLSAVGAGVTMESVESVDGDPFSAVLVLLPGAVGASHAVAWVGAAGFLVCYVLLVRSLRVRRTTAREAAPSLITRSDPA